MNPEVQGRYQSNLKTRKKRKEGRHLPNGLSHADVIVKNQVSNFFLLYRTKDQSEKPKDCSQ